VSTPTANYLTKDGKQLLAEVSMLRADVERRRLRRVVALDQISHVVETMSTISGTMRRVAINATIEAARAGQAGAQFAVVAAEIKHLAGTMQAAAEEARLLLKDRDKE
jgi:uncharacterized protein YoxC